MAIYNVTLQVFYDYTYIDESYAHLGEKAVARKSRGEILSTNLVEVEGNLMDLNLQKSICDALAKNVQFPDTATNKIFKGIQFALLSDDMSLDQYCGYQQCQHLSAETDKYNTVSFRAFNY